MRRRIAILAVTGACGVALSGCSVMMIMTFGGPYPPAGHADRSVAPASSAATAPGRAFTGSAKGALASRAVLRHGSVKSTMKNVRFTGRFTGKLAGAPQAGDENLAAFTKAQWHSRFSGVRDRRNGKITVGGLVLATYTGQTPGRACLRLKYVNARTGTRHRPRRGRSVLTVLGGEGDARTLAGSATGQLTIGKGGRLLVTGRVRARRTAERGFTSACRALEKAFKLAPLSRR